MRFPLTFSSSSALLDARGEEEASDDPSIKFCMPRLTTFIEVTSLSNTVGKDSSDCASSALAKEYLSCGGTPKRILTFSLLLGSPEARVFSMVISIFLERCSGRCISVRPFICPSASSDVCNSDPSSALRRRIESAGAPESLNESIAESLGWDFAIRSRSTPALLSSPICCARSVFKFKTFEQVSNI